MYKYLRNCLVEHQLNFEQCLNFIVLQQISVIIAFVEAFTVFKKFPCRLAFIPIVSFLQPLFVQLIN